MADEEVDEVLTAVAEVYGELPGASSRAGAQACASR
jgi:hypothetical protein